MGLHRCDECNQSWICLCDPCDDEGYAMRCQICSARSMDCHPYTRVGFKGAFVEWEKNSADK